jgi:hypothetical protein
MRKYPGLAEEAAASGTALTNRVWPSARARLGDLGLRSLRLRLRQRRNARNVKRGKISSGFGVSGADFSFHNIGECAHFLTRVIPATPSET